MTREVTVISSQTNGLNKIQSDAQNWGALQSDLSANNVSYSGMKAIIREETDELTKNGDALPAAAFTLFWSPGNVKSGEVQ